MQDVNAILVVYDVTDEHSFNHCEDLARLVRNATASNNAHLILVGNKIDSNASSRVISSENAENMAFPQWYGFTSPDDKQVLTFCEVSAYNNIGIEELFDNIILSLFANKKISERTVVEEDSLERNSLESNIAPTNNKKCCFACNIF